MSTSVSSGLLEIGLNFALHVREERLSTQHDACRLVYISDIHLRCGRSEKICRQVMAAVDQCQPDAVLLGGDLVDASTELSCLSKLVSQLSTAAPVLAMGGNHDRAVGMDKVRAAVLSGNGQWIHGQVAHLNHTNRTIAISGPDAGSQCKGDVRILCAHNPRIWKTSRRQGYDLVLAGHLHGCQVVAFEFQDRLFPGAFFYPYCYLSHQSGSTRLVVSRGVSDLVPIRWRCPREVVLCFV
jgi:predicted MPP superfamily phosphohydrolase